MKKHISYKWKWNKKAGVAILIYGKIDFKTKAIVRDKEGHYIMTKGSIQQEYIIFINIWAPNIGAPKHVKKILLHIKGEKNSNSHSRGF